MTSKRERATSAPPVRRKRERAMSELEKYAQDRVKVRVTFESGKTKWGWVHQYNGRWWLTRGNRVGFSLDTAVKIEEMSK
jgi:hypothetical protein